MMTHVYSVYLSHISVWQYLYFLRYFIVLRLEQLILCSLLGTVMCVCVFMVFLAVYFFPSIIYSVIGIFLYSLYLFNSYMLPIVGLFYPPLWFDEYVRSLFIWAYCIIWTLFVWHCSFMNVFSFLWLHTSLCLLNPWSCLFLVNYPWQTISIRPLHRKSSSRCIHKLLVEAFPRYTCIQPTP